jgi:hypothetical protein
MARILPVFALAVALVAFAGCVKSDETMVIKTDGSGTATMVMTLDLTKLEAIKEMMGGMMGGQGGGDSMDLESEMDPEEVRRRLEGKEGVRIVKAESVRDEVNNTVRMTLVVEFDSLQQLFESGLMKNTRVTLERDSDGNYVMTRYMGGDQQQMPEGPEAEQMAQMYLAMLQPFMGDLEMAATITLPTAILETSIGEVDGTTVGWKYTFEDIMKITKPVRVVFSGAGLDWAPFDVRVDGEGGLVGEEEAPAAPAEPVTPGMPGSGG